LRLFLITLFFLFRQASAQDLKYLIHLKDKKNTGFNLSDPSAFLSEKSVQRRLKRHIAIDSTDLPVTGAYADSLQALPSLRILNKSRWFNQLLISITDTAVLQQVLAFSFVLSSEPVNNQLSKKIRDSVSINKQEAVSTVNITNHSSSVAGISSYYNYGSSFSQIHIHHGDYLHDLGLHGESMTIAILDNGFSNYLTNPAFDSLRLNHRILGSYDFVNQKITVNEEEVHGAYCFSILASNMPGILVGSAPASSYWLFKTEDDASESPVEEQNWVAAAEFADSVGVDLISTSLGYGYFDDPKYDLNYSERNGHSALISQAANLAVAKGMIVAAAAGNDGSQNSERKYVSCPADGDSVYAVGAVDINNQIGIFSSWGPNGSGQVKPDGVSVGVGTHFVGTDGSLNAGNGTSFATPNLAGLITCLWQAFREFSSQDILLAVRQSSDKFTIADNRYGYGLPDFEKAYQALLLKRIGISNILTGNEWIRVYPVPFYNSIHILFRPSVSGEAIIQLIDISGKIILTNSNPVSAGQVQDLELNFTTPAPTGVYFIRYMDQKQSITLKVMKNG
jgi:serine protease AprX